MRREFGLRSPDRVEELGTDENPRSQPLAPYLGRPGTDQAAHRADRERLGDGPDAGRPAEAGVLHVPRRRAARPRLEPVRLGPAFACPSDSGPCQEAHRGRGAPGRPFEPRDVRPYPGAVPEPVGGDEPCVEPSESARHPRHALSARLLALDAARHAAEQCVWQPRARGLPNSRGRASCWTGAVSRGGRTTPPIAGGRAASPAPTEGDLASLDEVAEEQSDTGCGRTPSGHGSATSGRRACAGRPGHGGRPPGISASG